MADQPTFFNPAPGFVLIQSVKDDTGGVLLANQISLTRGLVLATGLKVITEMGAFYECPVKKGDIVLTATYGSGDVFTHKGQQYKVVPFREIRGTYNADHEPS